MKKVLTGINGISSGADREKSKIREFFQRQKDRLRHGSFTCPFCGEVFTGISAMGAHLKSHCT
ncbi:MAG: hypothetical protein GXP46_06725 [Deferribacteres bacterium]|nr:hypothetical protein [Deferribacteres bacterium]